MNTEPKYEVGDEFYDYQGRKARVTVVVGPDDYSGEYYDRKAPQFSRSSSANMRRTLDEPTNGNGNKPPSAEPLPPEVKEIMTPNINTIEKPIATAPAATEAATEAVPETVAAPVMPALVPEAVTAPAVPAAAEVKYPNFTKIASRIVELGGYVIPLPLGEKECTIPGWPGLATRDLSVVEKWGKMSPNGNFGVVGKPDGLWVWDVDLLGLPVLEEYEQKYGRIQTLRIQSASGGYHLYFRADEMSNKLGNIGEKEKNEEELWSARIGNRYVVGPLCVAHPNNDPKIPLAQYKVVDKSDIIAAPASLLMFLNDRYRLAQGLEPTSSTTGATNGFALPGAFGKVQRTAAQWDAELNSNEPILEGGRDTYLTSLAGILKHRGFDRSLLEAALSDINARRCQPRLDEKDIKKIAKSVAGYTKTYTKTLIAQEVKEPVKDAADYSQAEVKDLVRELIYSTGPERASSPRSLPKNGTEALNLAARKILEHIKTFAAIFDCEGLGYLLTKDRLDKPIMVDPADPYFAQLLANYDIHAGTTKEFIGIGKFIGVHTALEGVKTQLGYSSHYNKKTGGMYFAESMGTLLRITKDEITRVPNGTDGELFMFPDNFEPFQVDLENLPKIKYSLIPEANSPLMRYLLGDLVFADSLLSPEQSRILLTTHILLLHLQGIIAGIPLLQMIGPTGCGKTSLLNLIGRIVVGPTFQVQPLPPNVKEFQNVLINNDLVFFDNVKNVAEDLKDLFCQAVTGIRIVTRTYFTTTGQTVREARSSLGLSALTPVLSETEQANRSNTFNLKKRPGASNISEEELRRKVDAARGEIMADFIVRVQMILKAVDAQGSYHPTMALRLASFGTLILRVARHEGWEKEALTLLSTWNNTQIDAAIESDDISACLRLWMANKDWKPCDLKAEELNKRLCQVLDANRMGKSSWKESSRSLSVALKRSEESYENNFGLKIVDKKTHGTLYMFHPSEVILAGIRASELSGDVKNNMLLPELPLFQETQQTQEDSEYSDSDTDAATVEQSDALSMLPTPTPEPASSTPSPSTTTLDFKATVTKTIREWAGILASGGEQPYRDLPFGGQVCQFAKKVTPGCERWQDLTADEWALVFGQLSKVKESGGDAFVAELIANTLANEIAEAKRLTGAAWQVAKNEEAA